MLKIYKKIVLVGTPGQDQRLESTGQDVGAKAPGHWFSRFVALPVIIVGSLISVVFLAAFFALLLIPVAILGIRAWWLLRNLQNKPKDQCLDAEYTVISDISKADKSGK